MAGNAGQEFTVKQACEACEGVHAITSGLREFTYCVSQELSSQLAIFLFFSLLLSVRPVFFHDKRCRDQILVLLTELCIVRFRDKF
jgi:hypothetical protein